MSNQRFFEVFAYPPTNNHASSMYEVWEVDRDGNKIGEYIQTYYGDDRYLAYELAARLLQANIDGKIKK